MACFWFSFRLVKASVRVQIRRKMTRVWSIKGSRSISPVFAGNHVVKNGIEEESESPELYIGGTFIVNFMLIW